MDHSCYNTPNIAFLQLGEKQMQELCFNSRLYITAWLFFAQHTGMDSEEFFKHGNEMADILIAHDDGCFIDCFIFGG